MVTQDQIEPYVETFALRTAFQGKTFSQNYMRKVDIIRMLNRLFDEKLKPHKISVSEDFPLIAERIFARALTQQYILKISDEIAGEYYSFAPGFVSRFIPAILADSSINDNLSAVGSRLFQDAFSAYLEGRSQLDDSVAIDSVRIPIPPTSEIVNFDPNEISALDECIEEVVESVRGHNGDGEVGVVPRLLGQIRAGQELVRAGSCRAYLLYLTLIRALDELITKFKGTAIETTAKTLIEMLVKYFISGKI